MRNSHFNSVNNLFAFLTTFSASIFKSFKIFSTDGSTTGFMHLSTITLLPLIGRTTFQHALELNDLDYHQCQDQQKDEKQLQNNRPCHR